MYCGPLDQPAGEAIIRRAVFIAEHPRQQPHYRIGEDRRGNRAIGQNVIANGNLLIHEMIDHPLVDPFVVPAEQDEMRPRPGRIPWRSSDRTVSLQA
ncbi:MAG: hypothetical protein WDN28_18000 [Chthoniobacter sp.]